MQGGSDGAERAGGASPFHSAQPLASPPYGRIRDGAGVRSGGKFHTSCAGTFAFPCNTAEKCAGTPLLWHFVKIRHRTPSPARMQPISNIQPGSCKRSPTLRRTGLFFRLTFVPMGDPFCLSLNELALAQKFFWIRLWRIGQSRTRLC